MSQCLLACIGIAIVLFQEAESYRGITEPLSSAPQEATVHVIGDTHGDSDYLLRCLQSTSRIVIELTSVGYRARWLPGMSRKEIWEIVVLGDAIERSISSRENLLILKTLTEDESWGNRLVFLLGTHESIMLQGGLPAANGPDHWFFRERVEDLTAKPNTDEHVLSTWLRKRPVVYFSHGLLMMHGGLSKRSADRVAQAIQCQHDCGTAIQNFVNNISRTFFEELHEFFLSGSRDQQAWNRVSTLPYILSASDSTEGGPGVLWYSGWSNSSHGAGTSATCREAEQVGKYFGDHPVMVVGHAPHQRITQYCERFRVPILAVNTNPSECIANDVSECNFSFRRDLHLYLLDLDNDRTQHLPQSLRMKQEGGQREFASCQESNYQISCTTLRIDYLDDYHEVGTPFSLDPQLMDPQSAPVNEYYYTQKALEKDPLPMRPSMLKAEVEVTRLLSSAPDSAMDPTSPVFFPLHEEKKRKVSDPEPFFLEHSILPDEIEKEKRAPSKRQHLARF